jgi:ribosomal protein L14E/L6E/L27E
MSFLLRLQWHLILGRDAGRLFCVAGILDERKVLCFFLGGMVVKGQGKEEKYQFYDLMYV